MPVTANDLRTKIVFQDFTESNSFGEITRTWSDVASGSWAKIEWERGREKIRADRIEAAQAATITIRYRADLDETMRIRQGGTENSPTGLLQIHSIHNAGMQNAFLEIVATETDAD